MDHRPNKAFADILSGKTQQSKTSLATILHDVKKATSHLPESKRLEITKVINKLNADPSSVVTNGMSKAALQALGETGHLHEKYRQNMGEAIKHVKEMHASLGADSPAAKRRAEVAKKEQMWALARERRAEAEDGSEPQATQNAWNSAKKSAEAVKEKKKTSGSGPVQPIAAASPEEEKPSEEPKPHLVDMQID